MHRTNLTDVADQLEIAVAELLTSAADARHLWLRTNTDADFAPTDKWYADAQQTSERIRVIAPRTRQLLDTFHNLRAAARTGRPPQPGR
jgi:hypothetical protein